MKTYSFVSLSLGILLYILLRGVHPFDVNSCSTEREIARSVLEEEPDFSNGWSEIPDTAADLCRRALLKDPAKRPTAKEFLAHPWFVAKE